MTSVRSRPLDGPAPLLEHRPGLVWMSPTTTLVGFGEAVRIEPGRGPDRFARATAGFTAWTEGVAVDDPLGLPGTGPVAFCSFGFEPGAASAVVVPERVVGVHAGTWFVTTVGDADPASLFHPVGTAEAPVDRPRYAGASMPDVMWLEAVARAVGRIEAGEVEKVVLARDYAVWSKHPFDPRRILRRLHERFPECYTFAVDGLVGASPELLVRRMDRGVESVALAGSAARSADPFEDELLGKGLLDSDKNRREHEMAAASVGRALGEVCRTLLRSPEPELLKLANVQHLATRFRGTLAEPRTAIELAGRLHPTAAVGGTPTAPALSLIRELEGMDRGRYAGPVGWMDARGDGELAIALRCAELSGARARLFAGAGIVRGSLPEVELEETRLKLAAMLGVLGR